ncbi:MAG: methyltransferase domain-containing protein [Acidobacteria bacterium]|nr:methyltransferase domain-containing protein [Acidobacteriota bacterium]
MKLLDANQLERSSIVANSLMNRERNVAGTNSYQKDLRFDVLNFITTGLSRKSTMSWLDLCCGTGKAVLQSAQTLNESGLAGKVSLVGVDLVDRFFPKPESFYFLELVPASLSNWHPVQPFDLITCVHGLHYIGDKLDLITRAVSWLTTEGVFVANLDLNNLKLDHRMSANRLLVSLLKKQGLHFDARRKILTCLGQKQISLNLTFLGADDQAGPNYTGQPAVNSYYR